MAVVLPGGFNITNNEPVDARISLDNSSSRYGLSAANVFEGLTVYQKDTNEVFVLTDASDPSVSTNWSLLFRSGSNTSGVTAGLGIFDSDDGTDITISIDTGSSHFINGVLDSGVFKQTGSFYNTTNFLQITGSLTVESNDEIPFEVTSGSERRFAVQHDGVLALVTQSSEPTALAGGIYLDNSYNIFIGQE